MKKYRYWVLTGFGLFLFVIWTILVKTVDVVQIPNVGPLGFYHFNVETLQKTALSHDMDKFSKISDVLLYLSFLTVAAYAVLGLYQLIKRKSFKKVDSIIYLLLGVYITTVVLYFILALSKINYAPILSEGKLKASYPSTHLFICSTYFIIGLIALFQYKKFNLTIKIILSAVVSLICIGVCVTRIYSGHHYITDIIGSIFLTTTVVLAFVAFLDIFRNKKIEE